MKKPGREIFILRRLIVTINSLCNSPCNSPCHRNSEKMDGDLVDDRRNVLAGDSFLFTVNSVPRDGFRKRSTHPVPFGRSEPV